MNETPTDYALLRKEVDKLRDALDQLTAIHVHDDDDPVDAYYQALSDARDLVQDILFRFDTSKVLRDLRKSPPSPSN